MQRPYHIVTVNERPKQCAEKREVCFSSGSHFNVARLWWQSSHSYYAHGESIKSQRVPSQKGGSMTYRGSVKDSLLDHGIQRGLKVLMGRVKGISYAIQMNGNN